MRGLAHRALVPVAPRRPHGMDAAFLSHEDHKTLGAGPHCCQAQLFSQGTAGTTRPPSASLAMATKTVARGGCWERSGMLGLQGMPGARGVRCMLGVAPAVVRRSRRASGPAGEGRTEVRPDQRRQLEGAGEGARSATAGPAITGSFLTGGRRPCQGPPQEATTSWNALLFRLKKIFFTGSFYHC